VPTITFSSRGIFNSWSTSVNPNGLSFAAQPPVFANDVKLQLLGSAIVATPSSTSVYHKAAHTDGPPARTIVVRFYLPLPRCKVNITAVAGVSFSCA
jgi:hypothetical protein